MSCEGLKEGFTLVNKINFFIQENNGDWNSSRKIIRDRIVDLFKEEVAGTGKGIHSTKVIYCVEKTLKNEIIYLQRPAMLNKGFDFTVNVKDYLFKAPTKKNQNRLTTTPRHDSIFYPLKLLKNSNSNEFNLMMEAIEKIYYCEEPSLILMQSKYSILNNKVVDGVEYETLLKIIKWLFIEQDVTYWNFSGRAMFYQGLKNV
ncbi:hypothetical protein [Aliarcobacter butzleri]|uniref:hypothetical protein n=1 Tax=Aliarcobacter butzleri TaxID=28197 RepID=UPI002B244FDA|nr:hypothetical protein [Aliarcobacter butzleri]